MNSKQIKYVLTLAKAGSFSGAAEALKISQPSLSQYIKKIEDELDIDIFERSNGNIKLTDAGKAYIEAGKKILEAENNLYDKLKDIKENKSGSIVIGTAPFRSVTLMPDAVKRFKDIYKGMRVVIREMTTSELIAGLENGEFDFCVTTLPVNKKLFDYSIIMEEEMLLSVKKGSEQEKKLLKLSEKNKENHYPVINLKAVNNEEFVMLTENQVMQESLRSICENHNLDFKKSVEVKSLEAQIEMVAEGLGYAIVPSGITSLERLKDRVSYFSFTQEYDKRILAAVYQKGKYLTEPMKNFIKILENN